MKTNVLKKAMMPIAVAVLGIAGAFTTTSMKSAAASTSWQGHRFVSAAVPCEQVKMCQTENNGIVCRVIDGDNTSAVLKGKINPTANSCPLTLYKIQ